MGPNDLRSGDRWTIEPPIRAVFSATAIAIRNLGITGFQAVHSEPVKLGAEGRIVMDVPGLEDRIALRGRVVWSRLSKTPDDQGRRLYITGVRLGEGGMVPPEVLRHLQATGFARMDPHSLERKQEAQARKEAMKAAQLRMTPQRAVVPPDQVLLVEHALTQLRSNPQEAQKWYQRARFSPPVLDGSQMAYREDVVAIWEYLGRLVDIEIVSQVFESKRK